MTMTLYINQSKVTTQGFRTLLHPITVSIAAKGGVCQRFCVIVIFLDHSYARYLKPQNPSDKVRS